MTYQQKLKTERRWDQRALIISLYHKRMMLLHKKWSLRKSAKRLSISLGQASESIKLAQALVDYPEIQSLSRVKALERIKK